MSMRSEGSVSCFGPPGAVMRRIQDRILAAAAAGEDVLLAEVGTAQKTEIAYDHVIKELAEELELILPIVSGSSRSVLLDGLHREGLLIKTDTAMNGAIISVLQQNDNRRGRVFLGDRGWPPNRSGGSRAFVDANEDRYATMNGK